MFPTPHASAGPSLPGNPFTVGTPFTVFVKEPTVHETATQAGLAVGPVRPSAAAAGALRPAARTSVTGGFWHGRRSVIAEVCVPQGPGLLENAGNLENLRLAAGTSENAARGAAAYRGDLPFLDSDIYKWLEAAAWQSAETPLDPAVAASRDLMVELLAQAQEADGYLNSWFQVTTPGRRWHDLRWGHELYCAGHLIQAAVAHHRATGETALLDIAVRFADCVEAAFGPGRPVDGVCGHAEIETALVELFRETGERRYLDLAKYFVERRGHGLLNSGPTHGIGPGPVYCQDHVPVREATAVGGHAVRQLYFLAGVTDVAAETGDEGLRAAAERLWTEMTARKTYITGGIGAHHAEEDFGDPYELPTERAYCETCAAIASVQWSWRMALLTGESKYSDLAERTLFNAVLPGVALDGATWLYANPLQVRDEHVDRHGDHGVRRTRWFRCACCPPNVMRLLASLPHYFASADADGLQLHQYATGAYAAEAGGDAFAVRVQTDYPWQGTVAVVVESTPDAPRTLSLRVPAWCEDFEARLNDELLDAASDPAPAGGVTGNSPDDSLRAGATAAHVFAGWLRVRRAWQPGDTLVLNLAMPVRATAADPRVDAVRDCLAIERGPLVYCLEEGDQPVAGLDAFLLDAGALTAEHDAGLLGGVTVVRGTSRRRAAHPDGWWPYRAAPAAEHIRLAEHLREDRSSEPVPFTAIPYYAWANRADGAMRIWLPVR